MKEKRKGKGWVCGGKRNWDSLYFVNKKELDGNGREFGYAFFV